MNPHIIVHRQIGVSLKLFLDELGYKSVWGFEDEDHDNLTVLQPHDTKLLKAVFKEVQYTGFIPYHYSVEPGKTGSTEKGEKVSFQGKVTSKRIFRNVSGDFMLVLFETPECNYLWKSYKLDRELEVGDEFTITGNIVAMLKGLRKENIVLINYVRLKDANKDSK